MLCDLAILSYWDKTMLDHFSVLDTYGEQNAFISEAINFIKQILCQSDHR